MVDVVSRRCEETDCRRRPLYGHEGEKGRFCSYHKVRTKHQPLLSAAMHTVVHEFCMSSLYSLEPVRFGKPYH